MILQQRRKVAVAVSKILQIHYSMGGRAFSAIKKQPGDGYITPLTWDHSVGSPF